MKWADVAKESSSILYNGNHRVTYMHKHSEYRVHFAQFQNAPEHMKQAVSAKMADAYRETETKAGDIVREEGIWLVRFLDLGT